MYHHILKNIENYVTALFKKYPNKKLVFHNLRHTKNVVARTKEIAKHCKLSEEEMLVIIAAAWFHDVGHLFIQPEKHEQMSAEIMRKFMTEQTGNNKLLSQIEQCILATKFPTKPKNILQQIICDADTYHLGTKNFKHTNEQVYEEEKLKAGFHNKTKFNTNALKMLQSHKYYTEYCNKLLTKEKMKNIQKLKKYLLTE